MSDTKAPRTAAELQKLFRHLHSSSLPASPLGLTESFGWTDRDLHELEDVGTFIESFQDVLHDIGGPVFKSYEAIFAGEWLFKKRLETFFREKASIHPASITQS